MEREFIKEFESPDTNRTASVFRDRENRVFSVDCYEDHEVKATEIYGRQTQAEQQARLWCKPAEESKDATEGT